MINFNRVFAMVLRYTINMKHSFDRLTDMFYWPAMDLLLWGLTGLYFAKLNTQNPHSITVILTGVIFWIVIWRAQYEITTNLLSEMWDNNLVNVFASPLTVYEWITAVIVFGFLKTLLSVLFSICIALLLYSYPFTVFGWYILPLCASLVLTGWATGFFVAGFLIRYGMKIQTIAWMGAALLAPFSALYYPLTILPTWAQKVALFVPSSYVFQGMRELIFTHHLTVGPILFSFALNIVYLILSIWFFTAMFKSSKKLGLGRLT